MQLIYASRPFGFDSSTLINVLSVARRNNRRDQITGALICRDDLYLQLLEGPQELVNAAFARITRDDRHIEVEKRWENAADARLFPEWDMRHDPVRSWMWTPEQVRAGAVERASPAELLAIFHRVAAEPEEA